MLRTSHVVWYAKVSFTRWRGSREIQPMGRACSVPNRLCPWYLVMLHNNHAHVIPNSCHSAALSTSPHSPAVVQSHRPRIWDSVHKLLYSRSFRGVRELEPHPSGIPRA